MSQIFTHEYFLELSLLELHHDRLPGVTEVRRRELQGPAEAIAISAIAISRDISR